MCMCVSVSMCRLLCHSFVPFVCLSCCFCACLLWCVFFDGGVFCWAELGPVAIRGALCCVALGAVSPTTTTAPHRLRHSLADPNTTTPRLSAPSVVVALAHYNSVCFRSLIILCFVLFWLWDGWVDVVCCFCFSFIGPPSDWTTVSHPAYDTPLTRAHIPLSHLHLSSPSSVRFVFLFSSFRLSSPPITIHRHSPHLISEL